MRFTTRGNIGGYLVLFAVLDICFTEIAGVGDEGIDCAKTSGQGSMESRAGCNSCLSFVF